MSEAKLGDEGLSILGGGSFLLVEYHEFVDVFNKVIDQFPIILQGKQEYSEDVLDHVSIHVLSECVPEE